MEPQVSIAGEDILSFLSDNDKLIEGFLVQIDDDKVLAEMQLEEITQVWCVFRCNWKRSLGGWGKMGHKGKMGHPPCSVLAKFALIHN